MFKKDRPQKTKKKPSHKNQQKHFHQSFFFFL